MYKPKKDTTFHFIILFAVVGLFLLIFFRAVRPAVVESLCSDVASKSCENYQKYSDIIYPESNYENLKSDCIENVYNFDSK